jgi:hypothetical protein
MREIFTCWITDLEKNHTDDGNPAAVLYRGAALIKDGEKLQIHTWYGESTITVALSQKDAQSLIEALTVESQAPSAQDLRDER